MSAQLLAELDVAATVHLEFTEVIKVNGAYANAGSDFCRLNFGALSSSSTGTQQKCFSPQA